MSAEKFDYGMMERVLVTAGPTHDMMLDSYMQRQEQAMGLKHAVPNVDFQELEVRTLARMTYAEVETMVMARFRTVRKEEAFLQGAVERLELEFTGIPYADEVIEYIIAIS